MFQLLYPRTGNSYGEPLTVVYQGRRVKFTEKPYILFRYVNDMYRAEGQTEFDFAELSFALTGDEIALSESAIRHLIRHVKGHLADSCQSS